MFLFYRPGFSLKSSEGNYGTGLKGPQKTADVFLERAPEQGNRGCNGGSQSPEANVEMTKPKGLCLGNEVRVSPGRPVRALGQRSKP